MFYQAGADGLECDRLGRLALTVPGLRRRDRLLFDLCAAQDTPVVVTLGGGYGIPIDETVEAHANTYRELALLMERRARPAGGGYGSASAAPPASVTVATLPRATVSPVVSPF